MTKTIVKTTFSILFILTSLFAQGETVGANVIRHDRYIDSLRVKSNIWTMSYRNDLPSGTRIAASLGLDYINFFDNDLSTIPILKSTNQIFIELEGLQQLYFMYIKGAIQFYSIKGNSVETTDGYSEVLHENIYRVFEFPLGAGFTHQVNAFDFYIGINKVYFYGTNEKEIIINNGGNETSLGSSSRRTFQSELGFGVEAIMSYHFSKKLEFEINLTKYEQKDFSVHFSVWGPLKRKLWTN